MGGGMTITKGSVGWCRHRLVQAFLLADVSKRPDVGQGETEAELVFVADGSQGEAAVLDAESAAIPVVGGLHGAVLQEPEIGVEADRGGAAEAAFVGVTISQQQAELVEVLLRRR